MEHTDLFRDILLVTGAAFVGGLVAHALRLPTIIGFLAAGVAIGPNTPGLVGDVEVVELVAELGVIFLMFALGIQVSFREIAAMKRVALGAGFAQVTLTSLAAFAVAPLLGLDWRAGVVLGFIVGLSSTVVTVKTLESRGGVASLHGRAAIAICVFQDIAVVMMILVLPTLAGDAVDPLDFGWALAKGALLIAVAYLLATMAVPFLWRQLAFRRSRELSLLASLTFAVGMATGSALLGLSVAFGAFLAGLAVSESEFGFQTLTEMLPLRDVFATVFFVAIGMLIVPDIVLDEPVIVLSVLLLAVAGKGVITAVVTRIVGIPGADAMRTGAVLAQIGEFSFVLARAGMDEGLIGPTLASAFLLAAAASILFSPLAVRLVEPVIGGAQRLRALEPLMRSAPIPFGLDDASVHRHVIVAGYGRTGHALAATLAGRGLPYVVVDSNPYLLDEARASQLPFIYGDVTRPETLALCNVGRARILALTFANMSDARAATMHALALNSGLDVVVRGSGEVSHAFFRELGASEVVDPEFEASLEFVRHVLHRYGLDARQIAALQVRRRAEHYGPGRLT